MDSMDSICDLGVVLDPKLNFTSHIDSLVVKASQDVRLYKKNLYRVQGSAYFENAV
jgi:hypothetical protein